MAHVVCLLNVEDDRATFTWSEGPASFEPYQLEGGMFADFKDVAAEARAKLSNLVKDYLFGEEHLPHTAYELAESGHELYLQMFDPGAGQARISNEVRKWLESLRKTKSVNTLEIVVESPWSMPWNVVYDQEPEKDAFLSDDKENLDRWMPFWAIRYDITGGRKVSPLRRMPLLRDPSVLLVIDPQIRDGLPSEQQKELVDFIDSHNLKAVYCKDDLIERAKAERPDLLYWLSHATPSALVLGNEEITPRQLRKLLRHDDTDDPYRFGGIAFLNACQTAESAEAGSFFDALFSVGFSGMVGTEHQTVDTFASPLGLRFLEEFLINGEPIGSVMHGLRARVPLGLLYGTYCPPELRVEKHGQGGDGPVVVQEPLLDGTALGTTSIAKRVLPPLPAEPYLSLANYGRGDRALFAGRDDDVERFATLLDDKNTRILVLHGESGVGKSSFLRAGVIPYLEEECLGYRFMSEREEGESSDAQRSVIFVRATNDLFGQLAQALCDFCAEPYEYETPLGDHVSVDLPSLLRELVGEDVNQALVRGLLRSEPSMLGSLLGAISDRLPYSAILVIDQGEEVFTLAKTSGDVQRGRQALDMLRRTVTAPGDFKVICSLRTEYYGRLIDRLRGGLHDTGSIREYLLTDFDERALAEAIRRPTTDGPIPHTSEIPFEKYGFRFGPGVADEIASRVIQYTTQRRDSVLPLMQVICAQLYRLACRRTDRTITLADLQKLGGIEGGMRSHVEGLLAELLEGRPRDKRPLQRLFTQLYLRQPDGTLTTALLRENELQARWTGRMPFDQLLRASSAMRLLKVNSMRIGFEAEHRYVSLGHDALAKLAADWDEQLSRGARFRKAAAAIVSVSAVAIVMAVLAWRAERARFSAAKARDDAISAVETYFLNVSQDRQLKNMQELRRQLMEDGRDYFERFVQDYDRNVNPTLRRKVARANYILGRIAADDENQYDDAIQTYRLAFDEQQDLLDANPHDANLKKQLSDTWIEIGNARARTEEWTEARHAYSEAKRLREELLAEHQQNREYTRLLASVEMNISLFEMSRKRWDAGREMLSTAQARRKELLRESDDPQEDAEVWFALGQGSYNLGRLEKSAENPDSAAVHFREAIAAFNNVLAIWKDDPESRQLLGYCFRNLGELRGDTDNLGSAVKEFQNIATVVARPYQEDAANTYWAIGSLYRKRLGEKNQEQRDTEDWKAAEEAGRAAYDEAKKIYRTLAEQYPELNQKRYPTLLATLEENAEELEKLTRSAADSTD